MNTQEVNYYYGEKKEKEPKRKNCFGLTAEILAVAFSVIIGILVGAAISAAVLEALPAVIVLAIILGLLLILNIILIFCNRKKDKKCEYKCCR